MPKMAKMITSRPEHEVAYHDLTALLRRHADKLTAVELLAVAANMVGKLIALQDQRTMTMERAIDIVQENITLGNQHALEQLSSMPAFGRH